MHQSGTSILVCGINRRAAVDYCSHCVSVVSEYGVDQHAHSIIPRLFKFVASVGTRILDLVQIRIIHSIVELFLRQALSLGPCSLAPEFMIWFVPQVIWTIDRFTCVGIDVASIGSFWCATFDRVSNVVANIRATKRTRLEFLELFQVCQFLGELGCPDTRENSKAFLADEAADELTLLIIRQLVPAVSKFTELGKCVLECLPQPVVL